MSTPGGILKTYRDGQWVRNAYRYWDTANDRWVGIDGASDYVPAWILPSDVPEPLVRWSADTITPDENGRVDEWHPIVDNAGLTLVKGGTGDGPIYIESDSQMNDHPSVHFATSQNVHWLPHFTGLDSGLISGIHHIFAVVRPMSDGSGDGPYYVWLHQTGGAHRWLHWCNGNSRFRAAVNGDLLSGTSSFTQNQNYVLHGEFGVVSGGCKWERSGTQIFTSGTTTTNIDAFMFRGIPDSQWGGGAWKVSDVMIFTPDTWSGVARTSLLNALGDRYGITVAT